MSARPCRSGISVQQGRAAFGPWSGFVTAAGRASSKAVRHCLAGVSVQHVRTTEQDRVRLRGRARHDHMFPLMSMARQKRICRGSGVVICNGQKQRRKKAHDQRIREGQHGPAYKRATDPDYREGRKPVYKKAQRDHAMDLLRDHSFSDVERMTGISKSTLTREARHRGFRKSEL